MTNADIAPIGLLLPNGCRVTHGTGVTIKTPFPTIPLTMHELYPGGTLAVPSTRRGQLGFIPVTHALRLPRHVHVTMADQGEARRLLTYECIYLHAFETGSELRAGLTRWISYYNTCRPHSTPGRCTPDEAYGINVSERLAA